MASGARIEHSLFGCILSVMCFLAGCDTSSDEWRVVKAVLPHEATYAEASAALMKLGYTCAKASGPLELRPGETREVPAYWDCSKFGEQPKIGCPTHWRVILIPEYGSVRESHFFEIHRCG